VACIAIVLYAIENKYLTEVEKDKMQSFEENLRTHFKSNYGDVWEEVNKTGDWNDDLDKKFKEIVSSFMKEGSW
jgi:F-type H+-transporting ATPase subunit alpha